MLAETPWLVVPTRSQARPGGEGRGRRGGEGRRGDQQVTGGRGSSRFPRLVSKESTRFYTPATPSLSRKLGPPLTSFPKSLWKPKLHPHLTPRSRKGISTRAPPLLGTCGPPSPHSTRGQRSNPAVGFGRRTPGPAALSPGLGGSITSSD